MERVSLFPRGVGLWHTFPLDKDVPGATAPGSQHVFRLLEWRKMWKRFWWNSSKRFENSYMKHVVDASISW